MDQRNQLRELNEQPGYLRTVAQVLSYVFHPVFVPVYILAFLIYVHPSIFAGASPWQKKITLLQGMLMYGFFPIVSVLLLKALKFVNSIHLNSQRDRIVPYIICNIWYFWIMYVWRNLPDIPREAVTLAAAIFLASIFGLMANIFTKVSMHAIAAGVAIGFFGILGLTQPGHMGRYLSISVLLAGLVCTSRLIVSDHSSRELYLGLIGGIGCQVVAGLARGVMY